MLNLQFTNFDLRLPVTIPLQRAHLILKKKFCSRYYRLLPPPPPERDDRAELDLEGCDEDLFDVDGCTEVEDPLDWLVEGVAEVPLDWLVDGEAEDPLD
jgi:hypothetical protein